MNWLFPQHLYFVLSGADFSEFSVTLLNKSTRQCFPGEGLCLRDTAYWFTVQLLSSSRLILHSDIHLLSRHEVKRRLYVFPCSIDYRAGVPGIQLSETCSITCVNQGDVSLLLRSKINFQEWREWLWLTEGFHHSSLPFISPSLFSANNYICIISSSATDIASSRKQKSW